AEVMTAMFLEMLPREPGESDDQVRQLMTDDIMKLNGKQTIYQMIQFAARVKERGGQARDPLWYKNEYLRRLDQRIGDRIEGLRGGRLKPDDFLVFAVGPVFEAFRRRRLPLTLPAART